MVFGWGRPSHPYPSYLTIYANIFFLITGDAQDSYDQYQNQDTNSLGHEVLAGGAGFAAMHMFENRQRAEGMCDSTQRLLER